MDFNCIVVSLQKIPKINQKNFMGKILTKYLLSVMVLASILFIACKDDDSSSDDKNNTIVGVWVSD